jgi:adenosylcobinamide kinase / adenosylcobinamide-phosphate guanylyltransferase
MTARHMLVFGGQRSGKSRFAEDLVLRSGRRPVYVATGAATDAEMAERIAIHRDRRVSEWTTIEEPLDLAVAVRKASPGDAVLVECLTVWLANLMEAGRDLANETERLVAALAAVDAAVVLVSGEVGTGLVPMDALARRYVDELGILNQRIAAVVDRVVLVVAGQPVILKPCPVPEIAL